jgi:perosamine synthetase
MNQYFFAHARTALWYGLQQLRIERGQTLLIPDYICEVVIHPLEDLGIRAIFYPVNDQFVPDWDAIEKLQFDDPANAFLLVHFFGQPQDIVRAQKFCDQHGMWLIEDNAHGHGGTINGQPLGSFGDMGFSSPRKQLQNASGAVLYLYDNPVELNIEVFPDYPISKSKELLLNMIRPFPRIKAGLHRMLESEPDYPNPSAFPENKIKYFQANTASVKHILAENWSEHAARRRENWCDWSLHASENGLYPIWSEPHPESCPWMLPVYATSPDKRIECLKKSWHHGDDLFPWPSLPEAVIQSSSSAVIRWKHLLCFPLHKKLKK